MDPSFRRKRNAKSPSAAPRFRQGRMAAGLVGLLAAAAPGCTDAENDDESSTTSASSTSNSTSAEEESGSDDAGTGECAVGDIVCDEFCTDPSEDRVNCGGCGNVCSPSEGCFDGACVEATCTGSEISCAGLCVDAGTDAANCGGCGSTCVFGSACVAAECDCGEPVSFAQDVAPLLGVGCNGEGCHDAIDHKAMLDLSGDAHAALVGVSTAQCGGEAVLVTPMNPDESYLINKLRGQGMCSGMQMPRNDDAYSFEQVVMIANWICQGALDN